MARSVHIKARKASVETEQLKVVKKKEPPKRTVINNPLTKEQRAGLGSLINEWVTTSNLAKKPLVHAKAWGKLYEDDKALAGAVNGIEQIEQDELLLCRSYILGKIRELEREGSEKIMRRKDNWGSSRIAAIQTRCKQQGVTDTRRKAYMMERWGKDSLTKLDGDQLQECYDYAIGTPPPTWNPPREAPPSLQQLRETALAKLLDILEGTASARRETFDRYMLRIPGGKQAVTEMLFEQDKTLFSDSRGNALTHEDLKDFWREQKLCKFASGRPRKTAV